MAFPAFHIAMKLSKEAPVGEETVLIGAWRPSAYVFAGTGLEPPKPARESPATAAPVGV
jgi:hypothetical protein